MTTIIQNDTLLRWTCLNPTHYSSTLLLSPPVFLLSLDLFLLLVQFFVIMSPHIPFTFSPSVFSFHLPPSLCSPLPIFSVRLCYGPWALYYLAVVQWPLILTWRPSGISVISISVTCLSIFQTLEIKLCQTSDVLQITGCTYGNPLPIGCPSSV